MDKNKFLYDIMDAYIAGGGTKEGAIKYVHDVYGYVYTGDESETH